MDSCKISKGMSLRHISDASCGRAASSARFADRCNLANSFQLCACGHSFDTQTYSARCPAKVVRA